MVLKESAIPEVNVPNSLPTATKSRQGLREKERPASTHLSADQPDLLSELVNIKWEEGAPLPFATAAHTAVLFNEAIYVGGGNYDNKDARYRINIYHPDTNKWDNATDTPHALFAMTVLVDKLIIVGGLGRVSHKVTNKVLVLEHDQWKDYTRMPTARVFASVVSHQSLMIVMGGMATKHIFRKHSYTQNY